MAEGFSRNNFQLSCYGGLTGQSSRFPCTGIKLCSYQCPGRPVIRKLAEVGWIILVCVSSPPKNHIWQAGSDSVLCHSCCTVFRKNQHPVSTFIFTRPHLGELAFLSNSRDQIKYGPSHSYSLAHSLLSVSRSGHVLSFLVRLVRINRGCKICQWK